MNQPRRLNVPVGASIAPMNAYVLHGAPITIIDPGPDTEIAYAAVRDGLADAGAGISSLERIIITHAHVDHAGLAGRLHAESGARVLAHPTAAADLLDFDRAWSERMSIAVRSAQAAGVPPEVSDAFLDVARSRRSLFGVDVPEDALVSLRDGSRLRAGETNWSTLYTPGHSPDHIALASEGGEAIVGDLLVRGSPTMPSLPTRDEDGAASATLETLFASWHRLGMLRATRAWPGHGPPIRAPRVLLARRIASLRSAIRETRSVIQSDELNPWEVAKHTGLSTKPERLLSTLGHAIGRLEWLNSRSLIARRSVDGIVRYSSPVRRR